MRRWNDRPDGLLPSRKSFDFFFFGLLMTCVPDSSVEFTVTISTHFSHTSILRRCDGTSTCALLAAAWRPRRGVLVAGVTLVLRYLIDALKPSITRLITVEECGVTATASGIQR